MQLSALFLIVAALLQPSTGKSDTPELDVRLYASQSTVQPGGSVELAVELAVSDKWHIYHPIILETGAPTEITLHLPPGVTAAPFRWPEPTHGETQGIEYLELSGKPVALTTLHVSDEVAPGQLEIGADAFALACKELCIPVDAKATLKLPVSTNTPAPANQELFSRARDALPKPIDNAPFLKGSRVFASHEKLPVGGAAAVILELKLEEDHHVQDRDPGVEGLIPSRVYVQAMAGIDVERDEQIWPKPVVKEMPYFGKVRQHKGTFIVAVPLEINDKRFKPRPIALRVLFSYQSCNEEGQCFPPTMASGWARFDVVPADAPAVLTQDPVARRIAATLNLAGAGAAPPVAEVADDEAAPTEVVDAEVLDEQAGAPVAATDADDEDAEGAIALVGGDERNLLIILLMSFAGGLLLNIMPCVFPVISLKIISFVKQAGEDRGRVLKLGLMFCAGIMAWFWIFAMLTSIGEIPWQYPPVVIALATILFVFALNLFGVFEITLPGTAIGSLDQATAREGYSGAFMKGFLATLLGTACTAPFFATAAAFAATQPGPVSALIFTAAGLGMSSPYLVLSAFPGWLQWLPRPGAWMVTFKQAMGFVLAGTAVWLLGTLGDLLDARAVVLTTAFFCFIAFSAWLIGRAQHTTNSASQISLWVTAIFIAVAGGWFSYDYMYDWPTAAQLRLAAEHQSGGADGPVNPELLVERSSTAEWEDGIPWQPYAPGLAAELAAAGHTVYVDYTATWCVTCQANKVSSLEIPSIRAKMKDMGVIPIKADFTRRNPEIRAELLKFGHNSVPLNLVYPAGRPEDVVKLPVVLTPGIVSAALDQAGPSQKNAKQIASRP